MRWLLLCALLPLTLVAREEFDLVQLEKKYDQMLDRFQVPGASVALIVDGKVVLKKSYGVRNIETKEPVTSATLFPIASCTKAFTSLLLGMMSEEGSIDWDVPLHRYDPSFLLKDQMTTSRITLRDLVAHRTGFPAYDTFWFQSGLSREELMERMKFLDEVADLRAGFHYSNLMYMVAALFAEKKAHASWEDLVETKILKPLGMNATTPRREAFLQNSNIAAPHAVVTNAQGNLERMIIPFIDVTPIAPAGGLHSNLDNMITWAQFQLNGGEWQGKRLISTAMMKELHTPQVVRSKYPDLKEVCLEAYGLGWVLQAYRGYFCVYHLGNIPGFVCLVAMVPEEKTALVVMTNLANSSAPEAIARVTWDTLFHLPEVAWGEQLPSQTQEKQSTLSATVVSPGAEELARCAGIYNNPAYGELRIDLFAGHLLLRFRGLTLPLVATAAGSFTPDPKIIASSPILEKLASCQLLFRNNKEGRAQELLATLEYGTPELLFHRTN